MCERQFIEFSIQALVLRNTAFIFKEKDQDQVDTESFLQVINTLKNGCVGKDDKTVAWDFVWNIQKLS